MGIDNFLVLDLYLFHCIDEYKSSQYIYFWINITINMALFQLIQHKYNQSGSYMIE